MPNVVHGVKEEAYAIELAKVMEDDKGHFGVVLPSVSVHGKWPSTLL